MWTIYYMIVVLEFNFKLKCLTLLFIQNLAFIFPVDLTECFSDLLSTCHRDVCSIILPSTHCAKNLLYHMLRFTFVCGLLILCHNLFEALSEWIKFAPFTETWFLFRIKTSYCLHFQINFVKFQNTLLEFLLQMH